MTNKMIPIIISKTRKNTETIEIAMIDSEDNVALRSDSVSRNKYM